MMTRSLVALVAVAATLITACGSSGSVNGSGKGSFVKEANTMCQRAQDQTRPAAVQLFSIRPSDRELAQLISQVVPLIENSLNGLRRAAAQSGQTSALQPLVAAGDQEVARFKAIAARATTGDPSAVGDFYTQMVNGKAVLRVPFADFRQRAAAAGLRDCAASDTAQQATAVTNTQPGSSPAAKQAFLQKGDAVCQQFRANLPLDAFFGQYFGLGPPSVAVWTSLLETYGTYFFRLEIQQLRGIEPPPADKARIAATLGRYDQLYTEAQHAVMLAQAGNTSGFRSSFAQLAAMSAPADDALRQYGFTTCTPSDFLLAGVVARRAPLLP